MLTLLTLSILAIWLSDVVRAVVSVSNSPIASDATATFASLILTSTLVAGVTTAVVTGVFQFLGTRRLARVTERKNDDDADSSLVARYKDAAAEERAQKNSAVDTIQKLLAIAEHQIVSLKDTVDRLTQTIRIMSESAGTQQGILEQVIDERDRLADLLASAQHDLAEQRSILITSQREVHELTYPKKQIAKIREGLSQ